MYQRILFSNIEKYNIILFTLTCMFLTIHLYFFKYLLNTRSKFWNRNEQCLSLRFVFKTDELNKFVQVQFVQVCVVLQSTSTSLNQHYYFRYVCKILTKCASFYKLQAMRPQNERPICPISWNILKYKNNSNNIIVC